MPASDVTLVSQWNENDADYTAYNAAKAAAEAKQTEANFDKTYTAESRQALADALAKDVSGRKYTQQGEVDAAAKAINDAVTALELMTYKATFYVDGAEYKVVEAKVGGTASVYSMISYFGKVNYSYDGRYLASVTVRRDASSRFGKYNNSGIFPSVSLGWRLSKEKFLSSAKGWLDDLKIRAAWGINGNDMIDNSATYSLYRNDVNNGGYNIIGDNQNLTAGTIRTHSGNPYLRCEIWEYAPVHFFFAAP